MELTEYQKGFLSAFMDIGGHIFLEYFEGRKKGKDKYYPIVNVILKSSSMWVLEKARNMLNIRKDFNRRKKQYTLTLGASESEHLLKQITLIKREQQRLVALEIYETEKKWGIGFQDEVLPEHRDEVDKLVEEFYKQANIVSG